MSLIKYVNIIFVFNFIIEFFVYNIMITESQDTLFTFQNVCKQNTFLLAQNRRAYNFERG